MNLLGSTSRRNGVQEIDRRVLCFPAFATGAFVFFVYLQALVNPFSYNFCRVGFIATPNKCLQYIRRSLPSRRYICATTTRSREGKREIQANIFKWIVFKEFEFMRA